ncbi:MAG: putative ABC-type multidrug transport system, ATPase and permease component [Rhodoglobus sp.]|nr:putative ABC-type multidrug transport system, ATPase and permease component [Rhodoglobus sp.]
MSTDETQLPVASGARVRKVVGALLRRHRTEYTGVTVLAALAAVAGLVGPFVVGHLVQGFTTGTDAATVAALCLTMLLAVVLQTVFTGFGTRLAMVLGEKVFATLRDDFMRDVTAVPISVVEKAGTGDLLTRTTSDIDAVATTVRFAIPQLAVSVVAVTLTFAAAFVASPLVALALLVGIPVLVVVSRWYLRRAPQAYLDLNAGYSDLFGTVSETMDGARTVDTLALGAERIAATDVSLAELWARRLRIVRLKLVLLPVSALAYTVPIPLALLWGGLLVTQGLATVGAVTTVTLYAVQLTAPIVAVVQWLDKLQLGLASLARILGVGGIEPDRVEGDARPTSPVVRLSGVGYHYPDGPEVLHGLDLELAPGERFAIVGPSGAGKSTIGRILAGIDAPTSGTATVGGVPLTELPLAVLRREVALVTQEHHVFVGTIEDNVRMGSTYASHEDVLRALDVAGAGAWVQGLPDGVLTVVGSGGHPVGAAEAQQLALARLVLIDPHTLVLDEATSVMDARAARSVERALGAVLAGRTVVSIAHRLHTAHDADRIAVVERGRIVELGSHDELLSQGGAYAALWERWSAG